MQEPLQPPVPYDDFAFAFDPALHNIYPSPTPLPSSADLFTPSETTDLFGFLESLNYDIETDVHNAVRPPPDYAPPDGDPSPFMPPVTLQSVLTRSMSVPQNQNASRQSPSSQPLPGPSPPPLAPERRGSTSSSSSGIPDARAKPLLSTPQKRLNHIMSEQKRRNAIRDGYVQLTTLLAPAGAPPGAGMPTRGRPKGSGARNGRGRGNGAFKGKSGILFRAVEYIQWLEESRDALREEVEKLESAAGIHRR
ncbi:hypothetical protein EIP86_002610 [Pleurotus ostreatoroseus]|nr:hypothetical protein EIP86_002610 [Pleurotus ostreatoroseus]